MGALLDGLTDAQRGAVTHSGSPLLVLAGAGTGKTEVLARRCAWLCEQGIAPGAVLVLAPSEQAAARLRERIEARLAGPHDELSVHDFRALCTRLMAPIGELAPAAERIAMLIDHAQELELRRHDFRGRPVALFASLVRKIDARKAQLIGAAEHAAWAATLENPERSEREREFAALMGAHDRLLAQRGVIDEGGLLIECVAALAGEGSPAQPRARGFAALLVDDWQECTPAQLELVRLLELHGASLTAAGDDDQAVSRALEDPASVLGAFAEQRPGAEVVSLSRSFRCPQRLLDAASVVLAPNTARIAKQLQGEPGGSVRFWRAASERAAAQHAAAELERLIGSGVAPGSCAVLVRDVAEEGPAVSVALEERSVPHRLAGAAALLDRTEVRDVLAWLRLLVDPRDAAAVVRALARPPIELHSVDIARTVAIARRRRLDMVSAVAAALEATQLQPGARERLASFLRIQREASRMLESTRPDLFVHRLIDALGLRRHQLFDAGLAGATALVNLARLGELATDFARRDPRATPREFARYAGVLEQAGGLGEQDLSPAQLSDAVAVLEIAGARGLEFDHVFVLGLHAARMPGSDRAADREEPRRHAAHEARMRRLLGVAMTRARSTLVLAYAARSRRGSAAAPSPFVEAARVALGAEWEQCDEELFGPAQALHAIFLERRDELLDSVARVGGRLGELRLDTDLDVAHTVVRLLELVKLAALLERRDAQPLADALEDVGARLAAAATPLQREVLSSSPLDELLLGGEWTPRVSRGARHEEPSLEALLPRRGDGVVLSASDVETYRSCPLRYKYARILRIPREPTLNQRFGILIHQVLERFHGGAAGDAESELLALLDACWRRGGFGDSDEERQLREKARVALLRYRERHAGEPGEPRWLERSFSFPLGRHHVRGRVDRIDALPGGGFELIDYKTGMPRRASALRGDVQLALYAVAAREAWQLEAVERTYYYVLDDERVRLGPSDGAGEEILGAVEQVGAGILAQAFEPTPSPAACAMCDFRIVCPAIEK